VAICKLYSTKPLAYQTSITILANDSKVLAVTRIRSPMGSDAIDRAMMARCLKLAREGMADGELPFGSVISRNGVIVSESSNQTIRQMDQSRHAEIIAIAQARQLLGTNRLDDCTIYSIVEPCPMCAFCIRTARISRVVYALGSPVMGGMSRWNILCDDSLARRLPFLFRPAPEVLTGVLADDAQQAWSDWNPLVWRLMRLCNYFVVPEAAAIHAVAAHRLPIWRRLALRLSTWWPQQLGPVD
jgi:tRNA(adenine34) deaminase